MSKIILYKMTHEIGAIDIPNEYSSVIETDNGVVAVSEAAAMAGTNYGLAVTASDAGNQGVVGVEEFSPTITDLDYFRTRFYLDPNDVSSTDLDPFNCWIIRSVVDARNKLRLTFRRNGTASEVSITLEGDQQNTEVSNYYELAAGPNLIEIYVKKATNATTFDNNMELWIDGVLKETINLNVGHINSLYLDWGFEWARFGFQAGMAAGTSGTLYFDEMIGIASDAPIPEIGPVTFRNSRRGRYGKGDYGRGSRTRYGRYRGRNG